jgi:hypothetical protein
MAAKKVKVARRRAKIGLKVRCPAVGPDVHIYTMVCAEGKYEASSWLGLGWAIFTHRLWHLWNHRKWTD